MDDVLTYSSFKYPSAHRPLLGVTVLMVEDSRSASDTMRILCMRSGARLRRADCLQSARRHLQVYRPSVVVVDMGLPDGSGADLINEMHQATPRVDVIVAISGDPDNRQLALEAGANCFWEKPFSKLAAFQSALQSMIPDRQTGFVPRFVSNDTVAPDPLALSEDYHHAAELLDGSVDDATTKYISGFVASLAHATDDPVLEQMARGLLVKMTDPSTLRQMLLQRAQELPMQSVIVPFRSSRAG